MPCTGRSTAIACIRYALQLKPDYPDAQRNLKRVSQEQAQHVPTAVCRPQEPRQADGAGNDFLGGPFFTSPEPEYHSEHGQDRWLNENVFHSMSHGVFVEFGALDGVTDSNSLFFERNLHWTGICAEPNPSAFEKLRANRKCICEECAVAPRGGVMEFVQCEGGLRGWSGLAEYIEPRHEERMRVNIPNDQRRLLRVPCVTLNELLEKHKLYQVDYLSIDVEGAEFEILKTLDFDRFHARVFDIENNFGNSPIEALMKSKGYVKIQRLGVNDIFVPQSVSC